MPKPKPVWSAYQEEEVKQKKARQENARKQIQEFLKERAAEVEELKAKNQASLREIEGAGGHATSPVSSPVPILDDGHE